MDRYQKVVKPKPELPVNENEIRITSQGLVRNYLSYATTLLQERQAKEIVLKAMGQAISKSVAIAEIVKKRIPRLYQETAITSMSITDTFEPIEEGLQTVEQTRHVSMISITLSYNDLNKNSPGYQAPSGTNQNRQQRSYDYTPQQQLQPPRQALAVYNNDAYGRGRGRGRGRVSGWSRGGYGNYQDNVGNRGAYGNYQDNGGNRGGYRNYQGYGENRGGYRNYQDNGRNRGGYRNYRGYGENRGGYRNYQDNGGNRGGYRNYQGNGENRGGYRNYQDNAGNRGGYENYQDDVGYSGGYSGGGGGYYSGYSNYNRGGGRGGNNWGYRGGRGRGGGGRGGYYGRGRGRAGVRPRGDNEGN